MPVTLEGGMALLQTAATAISLVCALMRSGVSSITPCGGRTMPVHPREAAWHLLQLPMTISSPCANVTGRLGAASVHLPPEAPAAAGPSVESHTMTSPHTTATPHVHRGLGLPWWRTL